MKIKLLIISAVIMGIIFFLFFYLAENKSIPSVGLNQKLIDNFSNLEKDSYSEKNHRDIFQPEFD